MLLAVGLAMWTPPSLAAPAADVGQAYAREIHPLLVKTCGQCHGTSPKDNDLDLTGLTTAKAIIANPKVLEAVAGRLREGDMPPPEAPQPTAADKERLLDWIAAALDAEAAARAGDPGAVTLRRLSNPEYDNAVRDLTGVDMRPTRAREFPVDSVGGEGFANVGDAMPVTPGLVDRYHQAARDVAARAVLLPNGFRFSPSPDRPTWTAEAIQSLQAFHSRFVGPKGEQPLAPHLAATLRHRDRLATGGPAAIAAVAAEEKLSGPYLAALWTGLSGTSTSPILDEVRKAWRSAGSDPAPVLAVIKEKQDQLFRGLYGKHSIFAVGNGFPAWEEIRRVVGKTRVQGFARDPEFRLISRQVDAAAPWARPVMPQGVVLKPTTFTSAAGATATIADDGSVLVTGTLAKDTYVVTAALPPGMSADAFLLEALTDPSLPKEGPGRAGDGNFVIENVAASFSEPSKDGTATPIRFSSTRSDCEQLDWGSSGLIDDKPRSGWGVAPAVGSPHWVLLPVAAETRIPAGATLTFTLDQQHHTGKHAVGKFRLRAVRNPDGQMPPPPLVIWDNLRLEGGDDPPLIFAEHEQLRAVVEEASGLRFGHHPRGGTVPKSALVIPVGVDVMLYLRRLPPPLLQKLVLPRFLRADVRLDESAPDSAAVQAFLIGSTGGGGPTAEPVPTANAGDPLAPVIVPERRVAETARPAAEFRALFPPAVLFEPIVPRDAQASPFMYHREDEPLRRLVLDAAGRAELDRLWSELHFVSEAAFATPRMYDEIVQYYRMPNDGARIMFFVIQEFADRVKKERDDLIAAQAAAEPGHLDALLAFASRAWRRPLAAEERTAILAAYRAERDEGEGHDRAFRAALARVLASPWFIYRVEQPATGPKWQPVSGDELATRLSFLLWDSIPDDELRAKAARLNEPAVMEEQVRRMLKDPRVRGMAEEFGARWLGVHDFVANHGRSLKHFPEFTPALRDALAEEPVRFIADCLVNDRPVADLIAADAAVVNGVLAAHYGIPGVTGPEWRRVEKVAQLGRGGMLGFGAVLAKQAAAARTSPIKRGAWVAQMLGERLPKVPPDVPPLPESPPPGLSVREITERHRQDPKCAGCHDRIDPYGMALERFDAIGRLRPVADMKPGDTKATLRDGAVLEDVAGLRDYLAGPRRGDVLHALSRKLVGYALGRSVQLSDRALVDELTKTMADGGRWSDAVLVITRSEQFRCIRPATAPPSAAAAARSP